MGKIKTYWRNKAANAFFVVGQHAKTKEERIWGYRNSLLAGNEKAEKFYVIANIENFMQCSSKDKYMARFARLAKALSFVDGLNPQLFSVTYLNERDSKHLSTDRDNITASSNIVVNSDIIGKKAILVDYRKKNNIQSIFWKHAVKKHTF